MIHLIGPAVLASVLAGLGVYGLISRRNAVMVLIGAELLLNAANLLLVTAGSLPAGGLAALRSTPGATDGPTDPLLGGQVMTIFVITIAAAEIGLALAVVLLLFRARATSDLSAVRELGEAAADYSQTPGEDADPGVAAGPDGDEAPADSSGDPDPRDAAPDRPLEEVKA